MFDELDQTHAWRADGWRFSATTPDTVLPEHVAPGLEFRQTVGMPGYRTWLFRTHADALEFRRLYGVTGS